MKLKVFVFLCLVGVMGCSPAAMAEKESDEAAERHLEQPWMIVNRPSYLHVHCDMTRGNLLYRIGSDLAVVPGGCEKTDE